MNLFIISFSRKKSQSSMEFLIVFGLALTVISILGGVFFMYSSEAKGSLDQKQLSKIGEDLISNIEKVYFLGSNNLITYTSKFPEGIENFTIVHVNRSNSTNTFEFDYINVTYIHSKDYRSSVFSPKDNYIRFNCSLCYHSVNNNGNYTSYFNSSDFSDGAKRIRIMSRGEYVLIDFINQ